MLSFLYSLGNKILALILIIITSPVFLLCMLFIAVTSGFPTIFSHKRMGLHGKEFRILKFRTMNKHAEEMLKNDSKLYKMYKENRFKLPAEKDIRITRLGRILRKSSLDELPQFFNVLLGDMNIVGPRPMLKSEIEYVAHVIDMEHEMLKKELLSIKPGITGSVQTSGRSNLDYKTRIDIELEYIRKRNVWRDFVIMLKTPFAFKDAF